MQSHDGAVHTVSGLLVSTRLNAVSVQASTVACVYVLQVLDKAFMSGVLLMTAFWSVAAARDQPGPPHKSHSLTATIAPAATARSAATAGPTAARPATTAAAAAPIATGATGTEAGLGGTNTDLAGTATGPTAGADLPAADAALTAAQESTMPVRESDVQDSSSSSSSSLIAAELLDTLSYLQFCRMKLTAYNALLKNVLSSVSISRQVGVYSSHWWQHT